MGTSKILDKRYYKPKKKSVFECTRKNTTECLFLYDGKCAAEWCIFDKLPKIIIPSKRIKCMFCDNSKTVSTLSGIHEYICPECREKIKELMRNEHDE